MYCSNANGDCFGDAETLRLGVNETFFGMEAILKQFNVDIYLCAHEHAYERTYPVFNGTFQVQPLNVYTNPQSPIHIIAGSAGNQELLDMFDPVLYGAWSGK